MWGGIRRPIVRHMTIPDREVLLLHNSRCSKSRATQALLREQGCEFTERFYLEHPLTRGELDDLASRLGRPAREWIRSGEAAFGEAGLGPDSSEEELLDAMALHPILMERPIVVRGQAARVGRPPASVLELFVDE